MSVMSIDEIYYHMRVSHNATFREVVYAASKITDGYCRNMIIEDHKSTVAATIEKSMMRVAYDAIQREQKKFFGGRN